MPGWVKDTLILLFKIKKVPVEHNSFSVKRHFSYSFERQMTHKYL